MGSVNTTQCTESGGNVIVTDWEKRAITVLDVRSGNVIKVCDVKGKKPRGVTVDDYGNGYVCYSTGEISVWSRDMAEKRCLVAGSDRLGYPLAMIYDQRQSQLLVSSDFKDDAFRDFIRSYKVC